jgi:hypothetical protein
MIAGQKLVLEKLSIFSSGLYYTTIRTIEANVAVHQKCSNPNIFHFGMITLDIQDL